MKKKFCCPTKPLKITRYKINSLFYGYMKTSQKKAENFYEIHIHYVGQKIKLINPSQKHYNTVCEKDKSITRQVEKKISREK